jgi:hypothetical protein
MLAAQDNVDIFKKLGHDWTALVAKSERDALLSSHSVSREAFESCAQNWYNAFVIYGYCCKHPFV